MTGITRHRETWSRLLGRLLAALLVLAVLVAVPLGLAQGGTKAYQVLFAPITVIYLLVGLLIAERRPGNRVGPIVYGLGVAIGAYLVIEAYVRLPGPPPGSPVAAWAVNHMDAPFFLLIGGLFMCFPDGRLPSSRWRALVVAMAFLAPIAALAPGLEPGRLTYYPQFDNPFGVAGFPGRAVGAPAYVLLVLGVAASASALLVRWRRGDRLERAQLKWVATAGALIGIAMLAYAVLYGPGVYNDAMDVLVGIAFAYFPIAVGIAILRYRLYEIDRIISRTISWAIVTVAVGAVYVGGVLVLQAALGDVTRDNTLAVAGSTLLAVTAFQPVRRRVQAVVNRRFHRAEYDAERMAAGFAERLRDETDLGTVIVGLRDTCHRSMRPAALSVWLRDQGR